MQASEAKLRPIIEGTKQYVVPMFQRPYSWGTREWGVLWSDLESMSDQTESQDHFMGSIVTMPSTSVPEGVTKYLLIDGQQRMTTLFIVLVLLRDVSRGLGHTELADEIQNTLLKNPYQRGIDSTKLLPTQGDRAAYFALIDDQLQVADSHIDDQSKVAESQITLCYQYFERKLRSVQVDFLHVQALFRTITAKLSLVSIVLSPNDNPYLVFESLNAKGKPLSQADLIRNYFFMRIHVDHQEKIYHQYWLPMLNALGDAMTEFVRHYLMRDGRFVKESEVYETIKSSVTAENALAYLEDLKFFGLLYARIIKPDAEPVVSLRARIQRIVRLEATVIYPFLLSCYGEYTRQKMTLETFEQILDMIENYFIRRYLCNYPRKAESREMPRLHRQIHTEYDGNYLMGLPRIFQRRGYPSNEEVMVSIATYRLYGFGSRLELTRVILERLERSFNHREAADLTQTTIEHVMPQTLTEWWRQYLGNEWEFVHAEKLHVLGNLTLTGYNPTLSNKTYPEKRVIFAQSNISLNHYFGQVAEWRAEDIDARSAEMAKLAIRVWPDIRPEPEANTMQLTADVTHTKPYEMRIRQTIIPVNHWADVLYYTFEYLHHNADADDLAEVLTQYPSTIKKHEHATPGMSFKETYEIYYKLSAKGIYQLCFALLAMCGIGHDEFEVKRVSTRG